MLFSAVSLPGHAVALILALKSLSQIVASSTANLSDLGVESFVLELAKLTGELVVGRC